MALLIVEWDDVWRVDVFSASMQRLHQGFRFHGWTRSTSLSRWSPDQYWLVTRPRRLMIDVRGQPIHCPFNSRTEPDLLHVTWIIPADREQRTILVGRDESSLRFFH